MLIHLLLRRQKQDKLTSGDLDVMGPSTTFVSYTMGFYV